MAPTKKSSSAKAPAKKPMVVKKSQYELERDARIKRNQEWMIAHGFNPFGSGPLKEIKKKASPRPRAPKKYVPESERRRSPRLAGETIAPKRLTYDGSDEDGPKRRSQSLRRWRVRVVDDLSDVRRAGLEKFTLNLDAFLDGFEAWMEPDGEHPVSEQNRRSVMRQVRKLVSGEGVTYAYWPDDVIFRSARRGNQLLVSTPSTRTRSRAVVPHRQGRARHDAERHLGDHRRRQGLRGPVWRGPGPRLAAQPPAPQAPLLPALPRHEGAARTRGQGDDADEEGQKGQEDDRGLKGARAQERGLSISNSSRPTPYAPQRRRDFFPPFFARFEALLPAASPD